MDKAKHKDEYIKLQVFVAEETPRAFSTNECLIMDLHQQSERTAKRYLVEHSTFHVSLTACKQQLM
jgi:hypothetical protein